MGEAWHGTCSNPGATSAETAELEALCSVLVNASFAQETINNYVRAFDKFVRFTRSIRAASLPTSSKTLELFIAKSDENGLKRGTVRAGVTAISYHKMKGLSDPTRTYRITRLLKGLGKCNKPSRKLLPIGFVLVKKAVDLTEAIASEFDRACVKAVYLLQ